MEDRDMSKQATVDRRDDLLIIRIASAPCGASDAFMHPACAHGLDGVEFHDMTIVQLLEQEIVYCDGCGERILPKGVKRG
jgi:hypothetical protein